MHRRGFTLLEMLVATGVFIVGFSFAIGLFLAAVRYRKLSDDLMRGGLAASSIIEEIRLDAGMEGGAAQAPQLYEGNGNAKDGREGDGILQSYAAQPGIWYRVTRSTDLAGDADKSTTTALNFSLLVISQNTNDETLTLADIARRLRLRFTSNPPRDQDIEEELVRRAIAQRHQAVMVRKPSWANR